MRKKMLKLTLFFLGVVNLIAAIPEEIQYVSPIPNSTLNSRMSTVIIRPGEKLNRATINFSEQIVVMDKAKNRYKGEIVLSSDGKTLIFKPKTQYKAGEEVYVCFLSGVKDLSGKNIPSFEFQFTVTPLEKPLDPKDYLPETTSEIGEIRKSLAKTLANKNSEPSLPSNFPKFKITKGTGTPAEGYIFLSPSHFVDKKGFNLIIDNDGNLVYWKEITDGTPVDFKVLPNGYLSYGSMYEFYDFTGGGPTIFRMMDSNFTVVDSFMMGNGYVAESHEFQLLPNGHALMLSYDLQPVDMSKIVEGGHPGALVVGSIIQELDVDKNVIFQWRSWDYLDLRESYNDLKLTVFDPIHINSIEMDRDNNLLVSIMGLAQIAKINRQNGKIMWRMGGVKNQFTFVNEEEVSKYAPTYFMYQHDVRRLDNGNILMIDNGEISKRKWSRVVEYKVDEINFIATKVWQYRPNPDIYASTMGSAQRLPNGNTLIGWGTGSAISKTAVTEVDKDGNVVLQLAFTGNLWSSYRAYKFDWRRKGGPAAIVIRRELGAGNSYIYNDTEGTELSVNEKGDTTGVTIDIKSFEGVGYNDIVVERYNYAPLKPRFAGKTPIVLPHRIVLHVWYSFSKLNATLKFDANFYGIKNPESIIVYCREDIESGEFVPLPTSYNPVTKQIVVTYINTIDTTKDPNVLTMLREPDDFIFAYNDLEAEAFPPLLVSPLNNSDVNIHNVRLEWSPVGFVKTYSLQVATDENFKDLIVNKSGLKEAVYTFDLTEKGPAKYFWRVKTINDAGESEWSSVKSFQTKKPYIKITFPNGGEKLKWGLKNNITWTSITQNDVIIELYKDGSFLMVIDTAKNTGGYTWEVPVSLSLTGSYQIKIKDAVDTNIWDISDASFSLVGVKTVSNYAPLATSFQLVKPSSASKTVVLRYQLAAFSKVELSIYSIGGKKVATLVNKNQTPGTYEVNYDASRLAPTVYFFKFQAGENFIQIRRLALMK